jgi:demethoxyubiquinone hydroxylase (CLK1/Coq7/Cat5 family)
MLAIHRDAALRALLEEHLDQERRHLAAFNALLPWRCRSRLLVLWRIAGAITGLVAAIGGRHWTLATIAAVERFVDRHYLEQIEQLEALIGQPQHEPHVIQGDVVDCPTGVCAVTGGGTPVANAVELLEFLKACRQDECRHRDDALAALDEPIDRASHQNQGLGARALSGWCAMVDRGSVMAVRAAKAL